MDPGETKFPCLFDRLIDQDPSQKEETRSRRSVSMSEYRAAVLRDLRWLLNAPRHADDHPLYDYPEVARSVLNFGSRDLGGVTSESLNRIDIQKEIRDVIITFEPRIVAETLEVRVMQKASQRGRLAFEIHGHLWALPRPEQLLIRTEMDLETGNCEITE